LMASKESNSDYRIKTEELNKMEEELKKLQSRVLELEAKEKTLEDSLASLKEEHDTLKAERDTLSTEKDELAEFKAEIEAAKEKEEKLERVKSLFSESGVELPAEFLDDEEKREKLLAMDITQLEFLMHDLAIFASGDEDEEDEEGIEKAGKKKKHLGSKNTLNPKGKRADKMTPSEIAKAMKEDRE